MLSFIVPGSRSLCVLPSLVAELHYRSTGSGYPSCCCQNSFFDPGRGLGSEQRVCIQERLGRTLTTVTSTWSLHRVITHYWLLLRIMFGHFPFPDKKTCQVEDDQPQRQPNKSSMRAKSSLPSTTALRP